MSVPRGRVLWWVFSVVLVELLACGHDSPTSSDSDLNPPPAVSFLTVTVPGSSLGSGSLTPVDNLTPIGPNQFATVLRTTLVRFRASGLITAWTNFNLPPSVAFGSWGPGGNVQTGCGSGNVYMGASQSPGYTFCNPTDGDVPVLVKGNLSIGWNAGPGFQCGQGSIPCFVYTDGTSFTWSVDKIAAAVSVAPDRVVIQAGGQAAFWASITPPEYDGVQLPFSFPDYWRWKADTSSTWVPVCLPDTSCTISPVSSGSLKVSVLAQGDSIAFSGRVVVNSCPYAGDAMADDPDIRQQMFAELDTARAALPWNERGGYFFDTPLGPIHDMKTRMDATNTDCHNELNSPSSNGYAVKAIWHVHTIGIGEYWVNCTKVGTLTPKTNELPSSIEADALAYDFLRTNGFPNLESWILSAGGVFYKLDPTHHTFQTARRFRYNKSDPNHCLTLI